MKSENSTAQIKCTNDSCMHFSQSQYIHITNLEFIGCGGNLVEEVEEFMVQNAKFEGQENSGTALELVETTAQIVNSTFVSNRNGSHRECVLFDPDYGCLPDELIGGAIVVTNSTVDIHQSKFEDNRADYGGTIFAEHSIINIGDNNIFVNNSATVVGGVLHSRWSTITIEASEFLDNSATVWGGVLQSISSNIGIEASKFSDNSATAWGGVLQSISSNITIEASEFHENSANYWGGVLDSYSSTITIKASEFHDNSATENGGVLLSINSNITIEASKFCDHGANNWGGVLQSINSNIRIETSEFHNNSATDGGVLYSYSSTIAIETSEFHDNSATVGGVLYFYSSTTAIETSEFHDNNATIGGVLYSSGSTIIILASELQDNSGTYGGVLDSETSTVTIEGSEFHDNSANYEGGVLDSISSNITIEVSEFHNNSATYNGGVLGSFNSSITIEASEFHDNSAIDLGGVLYSNSSNITIEASEFHNNSATNQGGVLASHNGTITIEASGFHNNNAFYQGGVLSSVSSIITIGTGGSNFTNNVSPIGAVIYATSRSTIQHEHNSLLIDSNLADRYAVVYLSDSEFVEYDTENVIMFSNNLGSLVAFNSNITLNGYATFVNNRPPHTTSVFQEGGAITLLQSSVVLYGVCNLKQNHAENGGAIHSTESKLYVNGNVTIAHNTATGNGGGVYLSTSELNCQQKSTFELFNNTAAHKGGGLHAISSPIKATSTIIQSQYTGTRMIFRSNAAERGGGLSLEANGKLYILKYEYIGDYYGDTDATIFSANSADYGGAVYVDDDTNSGTCASDTKTECFFQVLALHGEESPHLRTQSIYFSQNYANISGFTLYGGLLDRCAVSQFAEVRNKYPQYFKDRDDGIAYFKNATHYSFELPKEVSINTNISISSLPVRVCICTSNEHNCSHQNYIKEIKKGERFTLSVVAVDQIRQPVRAIIQTSLHFTESGLAEGQLTRKIPAKCTNLTFNVVSPHNFEILSLYASDGPCKDADLSRATVEINFLPCSCPIGLQVSRMNSTNCICECHRDVSQYVEHCDSNTGSLVKQPQSRAWVSYINDIDLTGYLVYPNCPFDYCLSTSPPVDLNQPNGADAQCAFNRSSLLCGACQSGLSLSLGSSHCLPCPSYWPTLLIAIIIATILAGIALVSLLLVLNMTVAIGSLNGLIFYANVVYANKSILLPFQRTSFITVFISWLNLELGIDTCYFPGMNTYIKTWLQLAFPAYVIFLVLFVIIISSYSTKFSNLIGKKDPVATLATLILLSYAKFLEVCFKSLLVGILEYPDGSSAMLWLPDATVKYLSGKHIPLFIAAVLILLVGLVYTALLFSWQWLLYLPRWRIFKWSRNPKLQTFIETYHIPYTPKHRYWTGLLLIVRIILYLVAAVNVSNDPTIALTAITFTTCCIFAISKLFGSRLYRKWPMDVLETFSYFNILCFATFTWYSLDNPDSNQKAAAYTSVIITFIVLLLIILYHVYTYTAVFSKVKQTKLDRMIDRLFTEADPKAKPECHWSPPPDDDIHRFNELLDVIDRPVNTYDYKVPVKQQRPVKPTQSVVEVHQPVDLAADPSETADILHIPGAAEAVHIEVNEAVSQLYVSKENAL